MRTSGAQHAPLFINDRNSGRKAQHLRSRLPAIAVYRVRVALDHLRHDLGVRRVGGGSDRSVDHSRSCIDAVRRCVRVATDILRGNIDQVVVR